MEKINKKNPHAEAWGCFYRSIFAASMPRGRRKEGTAPGMGQRVPYSCFFQIVFAYIAG